MRTDLQAANLLKARYGAQVQDLTVRLAQARSAGDKATATTLEQSLAKANQRSRQRERQCGAAGGAAAAIPGEARPVGHHRGARCALPSVLVRINSGVVKVTELAGDRIKGDHRAARLSRPGASRNGPREHPQAGSRSAGRRSRDRLAPETLAARAWSARASTGRSSSRATRASGACRRARRHRRIGATLLVTLGICPPVGSPRPSISRSLPARTGSPSWSRSTSTISPAVPSIVFGLLGLAIFLNFFGMPRSSAPVGGLGAGAARPADYHHRLRAPRCGRCRHRSARRLGIAHRTSRRCSTVPLAMRDHDRNHHRHGSRAGQTAPCC